MDSFRSTDELAKHILGLASGRKRFIVAIAGIPGAGKSTLTVELERALNVCAPGSTQALSMDGFHHTNEWLVAHGLRQDKGKPETFDAAALLEKLRAIRAESPVRMPVYDRVGSRPVPDAVLVTGAPIILLEGNYLLCDFGAWRDMQQYFDYKVFIDTPKDVAKEWILARHESFGKTNEHALAHYERVDGVNAVLVETTRRSADALFKW